MDHSHVSYQVWVTHFSQTKRTYFANIHPFSEMEEAKCPYNERLDRYVFSINTHLLPLLSTKNQSCTALILLNLVEPQWLPIDCETPIVSYIYCVSKPDIAIQNLSMNTASSLSVGCHIKNIRINFTCYNFLWISPPRKVTYSIHAVTIHNIQLLEGLFDAFSEPFLPVISSDLRTIISVKRCSRTYQYETVDLRNKTMNTVPAFIIKSTKLHATKTKGQLFVCQKNVSISILFLCDGKVDCPENDSSDEANCVCKAFEGFFYKKSCKHVYSSKQKRDCSDYYYPTKSGCHMYLGNQENVDFSPYEITSQKFKCTNLPIGKQIQSLPRIHQSNSSVNFAREKEMLNKQCKGKGHFPCSTLNHQCFDISDTCIYKYDKCKILIPCRTGEHIQSCKQFSCNVHFKCHENYCILWSYVCDGKWDCPDGYEENSCFVVKDCLNLYKCRHYQLCTHSRNICDGHKDCPGGDDEEFCSLPSCPSHCECLLFAIRCHNISLEGSWLNEFVQFEAITLQNLKFSQIPLIHIQKPVSVVTMSFTKSNVSKLCPITFHMLHIVHLDVSFNLISIVHTNCFAFCRKIKTIKLNSNRIYRLEQAIFPDNFSLVFLNLSDNLLLSVCRYYFDKLTNVKLLVLGQNPLHNLETELFDRFTLDILQTDKHALCCIIPSQAKCVGFFPWYSSCHNILASVALEVAFYIFSFSIILANVTSIAMQRISFVHNQSQHKTGAYGTTVAGVSIANLLFALYLCILWIGNLVYKDRFQLFSQKWRSSFWCYLGLTTNLLCNLLSPMANNFHSLARLMVVLSPVDSIFKETSFIRRCVIVLLLTLSLLSTLVAFLVWIIKIPMILCSPLIDPTGSIVFVKIVTWLVMFVQCSSAIFMAIVNLCLFKQVQKSEKTVQEAKSKTQSFTFLIFQVSVFVCFSILTWIPNGTIFMVALFLERYPQEMLTWAVAVVKPVNFVLLSLVFLFSDLRKLKD